MRTLSVLLGFVLALQFSLNPAFADTMSFKWSDTKSGGTISGTSSVKRIGNVQVPGGTVVVKDNAIDVLFANVDLTKKDFSTNDKALTGTAFNVTVNEKETGKKIEGLAYFKSGKKISELNVPDSVDKLTLITGTTLTGKIVSLDQTQVEILLNDGRTEIVNTKQISTISSPNVFKFSIPLLASGQSVETTENFAASTEQVTFEGTYDGAKIAKRTESSTTSTTKVGHGLTKKKVAIIIIGGLLIATAIAVPLAVALGGGHHHNNRQSDELARLLLLRQSQSQPQTEVEKVED